jgi:hypothetical protein
VGKDVISKEQTWCRRTLHIEKKNNISNIESFLLSPFTNPPCLFWGESSNCDIKLAPIKLQPSTQYYRQQEWSHNVSIQSLMCHLQWWSYISNPPRESSQKSESRKRAQQPYLLKRAELLKDHSIVGKHKPAPNQIHVRSTEVNQSPIVHVFSWYHQSKGKTSCLNPRNFEYFIS